MSRTPTRLGRAERDSLFPEFRLDDDDHEVAPEEAPVPALPAKPEPLIISVMARLAEVLAEETRLIRAGDFEAFSELQREKGELIRKAERLENNRSALAAVEGLEPEALKAKLEGFNETVESNMRAIGAVKDAITHVRDQAIRKLEEEKGDGVYSKAGERKSLHRLSLNETQVKL